MVVNKDYKTPKTISFTFDSNVSQVKEVSKLTGSIVDSAFNLTERKLTADFAPGEHGCF